jgi:hypothetical protein
MSLQINLNLFLVIYIMYMICGLAEYVCVHPCLTNCFSEEDPDFVPEDVE